MSTSKVKTVRELPAVSIGIPFYNAENYLLDAIKSVFAQTHKNWELILLDDGSTDRSLEIARSIDDPRVRVYSDGQNKRLAARLNEIAHLARFDYLARMDADDLMARDRLEKQLHVLLSDSQADLVTTGVCSLRDDGEPVGFRCVPDGHQIVPYRLLGGKSGIVHAAVLGRRKWFLRNPYDESLPKSEDANLWVRAFAKRDLNVRFITEPLYFYREDGNVTIEKLLLSYRIGRGTIIRDANETFGVLDRVWALSRNSAKSVGVWLLSTLGKMDLVRARRNTELIDRAGREYILSEIIEIQSVPLPLRACSNLGEGN
ncbi:MAG: glycosyltransferase family A protein [Rhodothermales bacterium]